MISCRNPSNETSVKATRSFVRIHSDVDVFVPIRQSISSTCLDFSCWTVEVVVRRDDARRVIPDSIGQQSNGIVEFVVH